MAHRSHDTVGTRVESSLDHPFLCAWHSDDGTCVFGTNRIGELEMLAHGRSNTIGYKLTS